MCYAAAIFSDSVPERAWGSAPPETEILLVNFGGTASENVFGISGWNTVIKDVYTGYRTYGPGGTTITVGSAGSYDYQGVTGQPRTFSAGERIAVTWYNNSDAALTFAPKISFDDPDRRAMGITGIWHSMSSVTAGPGETAQSFFEFDEGSQGTYGIVNVNVNYANHEILICDRIELVVPGTDTEPPSVPQNLRAEIVFGLHILLMWDHSPDNAATAGYRIYSGDGIETGDTADTQYMIADAGPGTHTYTVSAYDVSGNGSAPSGLTVTVRSGEALLLADFGGTAAETLFGISGWNTVIKDVYTGYRAYGPGGTAITVGSEAGYNYQGVTGQPRSFAAGERIAVTWYNNSDAAVTFAPKISFNDPDRRVAGTAGTWRSMSSTVAGPRESAQSFFEFDADSQGNYGLANVNVNYSNREILVCDRIELIIPGTAPDTEPPSVPQNLSAEETPVISGHQIDLSWNASSDDTGVTAYNIFRDGIFLAEVPDTEYGDPDVLPGTSYFYTVSACDAAGNCSEQSSPVSVTIPLPPPEIVSFAADTQTVAAGNSSVLTWKVNNADTVSIDQGIGGVAAAASVTVKPVRTAVYTLRAENAGGAVTASATVTVEALSPITLNITSPAEGENLSGPDVTVEGTVVSSSGTETGININGIIAAIYGDRFAANRVPLGDGENTLTATAADTEGNTAAVPVNVNASADADCIRITPVCESSLSPLETTLKIEGPSGSAAVPSLTYTGPGTAEFIENDGDIFKVRITGEGIGHITAEVTDSRGNLLRHTLALTVLSRSVQDAWLKARWNMMKNALVAGDTEAALNCFAESSKDGYREIFSLLSPGISDTASAMRDSELIYVRDYTAKSRIRREQQIRGTVYDITYYIYFVKDIRGLWSVEKF